MDLNTAVSSLLLSILGSLIAAYVWRHAGPEVIAIGTSTTLGILALLIYPTIETAFLITMLVFPLGKLFLLLANFLQQAYDAHEIRLAMREKTQESKRLKRLYTMPMSSKVRKEIISKGGHNIDDWICLYCGASREAICHFEWYECKENPNNLNNHHYS